MSEEIETTEETATATATATGIKVETPEISVDISRYPSSVMLRSLRERFLAVKVTVESPPMEKIIPDAEIRSGDQVVPKDLVAGARFKVLPQNLRNQMARIGARARNLLTVGTPFVGGSWLIPVAPNRHGVRPVQQVLSSIEEVRQEYRAKAEELRPMWEQHVERIKTDFPVEYEVLKGFLVSGEEFVNRHKISAILFPMGGGLPSNFDTLISAKIKGMGLTDGDSSMMERLLPDLTAAIKEVCNENAGEAISDLTAGSAWLTEAQRATSEAIGEAVKKMVQEPLTEFAQTLAHLEESLNNGAKLRSSSFNAVKEAYDKLQAFSFMATGDLQQRLANIRNSLEGINLKDLNNNSDMAKAMSASLKNVREELTAVETHERAFGGFVRTLSLD